MSMNLTAVAEIKGKMVTDMTSDAEMTRRSSFLGLGSTGKKGLKFESTSIFYDYEKFGPLSGTLTRGGHGSEHLFFMSRCHGWLRLISGQGGRQEGIARYHGRTVTQASQCFG